ncbi:NUDIX domain-containing protein [Amycolatopsis sp. PS_44_ISF1]|uniref:NUDIX domain-containing protein n=1 Tax=Amycolatopsis sp. PS_44_ISF1 TaxID=2974917 RepID=UPI0028DD75EC|nr:NUDIX domain-containing protein [Amycolatopsis sp. PS_44_ISF1]MDT8915124.1 NUDIX domain-containing protein [Amycolatopsis sp. PS_44_ISF1]
MTSTPYALGPLVAVYGLVGHDDRLLVLSDPGAATHRLPGGLVRPDEAAEDALRRLVGEQAGNPVAHWDFSALVELRGDRGSATPPVFELALLFDVTLTDAGAIKAGRGEARWVTDAELGQLDLRPARLHDRMRRDGLTGDGHPWWPDCS